MNMVAASVCGLLLLLQAPTEAADSPDGGPVFLDPGNDHSTAGVEALPPPVPDDAAGDLPTPGAQTPPPLESHDPNDEDSRDPGPLPRAPDAHQDAGGAAAADGPVPLPVPVWALVGALAGTVTGLAIGLPCAVLLATIRVAEVARIIAVTGGTTDPVRALLVAIAPAEAFAPT